ncbi:hypothetical protein BCR36DRAFT_92389 [Piromyces finnis]|uniref:Uncharacterized protein n=1 Tax=Piromyces finnis TaxID=1754191 RepID=A0A1Y1V523_9FUNG|nr:hypothetical protein BCR36DRAFT_92389 [Piromyces finnis]|eukprot:ORX47541.1 hypothetical protein BCR36DRAFT_92389 [Piromyces finnis]
MVNPQDQSSNTSTLRSNLSLSSGVSSAISVTDQKQNEMIYSYVLRCCLYPLTQESVDFYCSQKVGSKFRSYVYKKSLNIVTKPPKTGSNNNLEGITKYIYYLSIQDFYKNMEDSSYFKDYLIFFTQINEIQIKLNRAAYKLTDEDSDIIIINAANNFVKLFKDFAAKHLENFKESKYDTFKQNVYLSQLVYFLKTPKKIESLEVDNNIQNWARKVFKIDSSTHHRVIDSIKTKINQKVI